MNLWAHIKQHNEQQRMDLDELFMERKQQEEEMGQIEEELSEMELVFYILYFSIIWIDGRKQAEWTWSRFQAGIRITQEWE